MKYLILLLVCFNLMAVEPELTPEQLAAIEALAPKLDIPVIVIPVIVIPELMVAETVSPEMRVELFDTSLPAVVYAIPQRLQTPKLIMPNLDEARNFMNNTNFVKDEYTRQRGKRFNSKYKNLWKRWKKISTTKYNPIKYVPYNDRGLRMIAEMRTSSNLDNLKKELSYFKANGYNAVLACWRGENSDRLISMIREVKSLGFKVWFTFGGKESVSEPVYIYPERYADGLQELSAVCDGYVLGWRRTSRHLFIPDKGWIGYTLENVRKGNPSILIIGEIYHGYEASKKREDETTANIPTNASAVMVVNVGYRNSNTKRILKTARRYTNLPLISLVIGDKAYYMSTYNNNKTRKENREICMEVEDRFIRLGFAGTITIAGDGSDREITDNLCQSEWHKGQK